MDVKSVAVPASASASAPLDIDVEVTVGGCNSFKRFEANRTVSRLTLRALGNRTLNVPCPAYIGWEHHIYTDPGSPTRTGPFEVIVNGTSWGTVRVH